jgi:hypothetical protein
MGREIINGVLGRIGDRIRAVGERLSAPSFPFSCALKYDASF